LSACFDAATFTPDFVMRHDFDGCRYRDATLRAINVMLMPYAFMMPPPLFHCYLRR